MVYISKSERTAMKILVIGGSYFLGKHFVELASNEKDVTVFNRGNRPLGIPNVKEIKGDRTRREDLEILKSLDFDAVVDFCAYSAGDISEIISVIGEKIKHYIFISTVDVYKKGTGSIIDENSPLETTVYSGEVGQYIAGKVALEDELKKCCGENDIAYTSIRPVIIYGPDNYAPREGIFFNWVDKAGQVLAPEDESGYFQMVYVDDLANAVSEVCGNEFYFNKAVNICGNKVYNYEEFLNSLKKGMEADFQVITLPVADIINKGIALPFALTAEESEEYKSLYTLDCMNNQTSLEEGLKKSYYSMEK